MEILKTVLGVFIGVIAVLLIAVVLLQPSKTEGFQGEAPSLGDNLYGKSKGVEALLKKATIILTVLFLLLTLILAIIS
ncbi:MAG: preprotein translocase subunit SecG [Fusobacteria bacterium]|nr:preprotein translocase subunit SecG [Fusobacteriota bacterium]